mmetsp:Transcript_32149/g.55525  ORF Transcript_32149/g.55525 Transcript_32149/m.55525 type:complete len:481 (+) Transcript_32149:7-1449(+)
MESKPSYDSLLVWRVCINLTLNCMYGGYTSLAIAAALECASWELGWGESKGDYISFLAAIFAVGAAFGGVAAGILASTYGRRKALIISDIIGISSCVILFLPSATLILAISRITGGFAFGLMLSITPPFLKEMSPAEMSGKTGNLVQLQICVGNLMGFISSLFLPISETSEAAGFLWRFVLIISLIPLAVQLFMLLYVYPYDSPSWLISERRIQEASQVIKTFYSGKGCESIHRSLVESYAENEGPDGPVSAALVARRASYYDVLFDWRFRRMLSIGLVLMMVQQWSGINAVTTYASIIFESITDRYSARCYTVLLGVVNLTAVLCVIPIIDKYGRVPLLWMGQLALGVVLVLLGLLCMVGGPDWLIVLMLCVYLAIYIPSLGSGIWVYCGEVLNMKSMGAAVCFNWINAFFVLLSFNFITSLGLSTAFWLYAVCCMLGSIYSSKLIETRGLTKEQICSDVIVTKNYSYLKGSQYATIVA